MEYLEQPLKNPRNAQHSDNGNAQHHRQVCYHLEHLKHSTLRLPFSASGRNWDETETIWPLK